MPDYVGGRLLLVPPGLLAKLCPIQLRQVVQASDWLLFTVGGEKREDWQNLVAFTKLAFVYEMLPWQDGSWADIPLSVLLSFHL